MGKAVPAINIVEVKALQTAELASVQLDQSVALSSHSGH